jgi:general secretion pathway protein J
MRRLTPPPRGFTLLEVMIAASILAVMGAMVFGSFSRAYTQKQQIENADDRLSQARGALDRMAAELSVAFLSEHYDRKRFQQRPTLFKGEDRSNEDQLTFTALANERLERDVKAGDQAVIKYFVDRDRAGKNKFESLYRRSWPIIDEEAERRGVRQVLCENVKSLDFQFWDAAKSEWVDEWDSSRPERNGILPERIRITLVIFDEEAKEKKFVTQTRVMMQRSLDF